MKSLRYKYFDDEAYPDFNEDEHSEFARLFTPFIRWGLCMPPLPVYCLSTI